MESLPGSAVPESAVLLVFDDRANKLTGKRDSLSEWAGSEFPEAQVLAIAETVTDEITAALSSGGADRVVLISRSASRDDSELQAALARCGVDPLSLVVVDLLSEDRAPEHDPDVTRALALIRGGVARAQEYRGAAAENMKIEFVRRSAGLSRRDLFKTPRHRYVGLPAVLPVACGAGRGCTVCADVCPFNAIGIRGRKVSIQKDKCTRCARCLSACPTDAMYLPDCIPERVEAEINAALQGGDNGDPRSVVFMCERGLRQLRTLPAAGEVVPPEWLPVEVPCLAAVRPAWIYHALGGGADRVVLSACFESCAVGQSATAAGTVDGCREVLNAIGADPELVRYEQPGSRTDLAMLLDKPPIAKRLTAADAGTTGVLSMPDAEYQALRRLVQAAGFRGQVTVHHPATRTARVTIDHPSCTGCLTCVDVCPPEALRTSSGDGRLAISFDAGACTGCGLCERKCPENEYGAIKVERAVVVGLSPAREIIFSDTEATCKVCGKAIAPNAMLRKVEQLLLQDDGDFDAIVDRVKRHCTSCRILS